MSSEIDEGHVSDVCFGAGRAWMLCTLKLATASEDNAIDNRVQNLGWFPFLFWPFKASLPVESCGLESSQ